MTDNSTALVTGASSGIGRAVARRLAQSDIRVLVGYNSGRERARLLCEDIEATYDIDAVPVSIDLSQPHQVSDRFRIIVEEYGPIEHLVNNAGVNDRSSGFALDAKRLDEVVAINIASPSSSLLRRGVISLRRGSRGRSSTSRLSMIIFLFLEVRCIAPQRVVSRLLHRLSLLNSSNMIFD